MNTTSQTYRFIREAFRKERWARSSMEFRWGLSLLLLSLLFLLLLDAIWALPVPGLQFLRVLLGLVLLGVIVSLLYRSLQRRFRPKQVALQVQERLGIPHDRLINALDFAEDTGFRGSQALREMAMQLSEDLTGELETRELMPRRQQRISWASLLGVSTVILVVLLWMPGLLLQPARRLWDPQGEHPPFTWLRFDIQVNPEQVHAGDHAEFQVQIRGPKLPEHASLLLKQEEQEARRLELFARPPVKDQTGKHFILKLRSLREDLVFCVDTPRGRSEWQRLRLHPSPRFEEVGLRYRYPDYTGWEDKELQMRSADLKALAGSMADLQLQSNLPLSHGELTFYPEQGEPQTLRLERTDQADQVEGTLALNESGVYQIRLVAEDGTPSDQLWEGSVEVHADEAPQVRVGDAGMPGVVPSNWRLEINGQAEDDVAIAEARLRYQLQAGGSKREELLVPADRKEPHLLPMLHVVDLAELQVPAGTEFRYMLEARDNRPPEGQWGRSQMAKLHVVSPEVYQDLARSQYRSEDLMNELQGVMQDLSALQDQREALLEELEAYKQGVTSETDSASEAQRTREQLTRELSRYQSDVGSLNTWIEKRLAFEQLYAFEEPYREWLASLQPGLDGQSADAAAVEAELGGSSMETPWPEQLESAFQRFRENEDPFPKRNSEQLQNLEADVDLLSRISDLMYQTQRLQHLAEQQRELAEQMDMIHRGPDSREEKQDALRELSRQQKELQQELKDVRRDLKRSGEALSEDEPELAEQAAELRQAIDDLQIPQDQARSAQEASQGQGGNAEQFATLAAAKLEELSGMAGECAGSCQGAGSGCTSLSAAQVEATLAQMLSALAIQAGRMPSGFPMGLNMGGMGMGMGGQHSLLGMMGPQYPSRGGNSSALDIPGRSLGDGRGGSVEMLESSTGEAGGILPDSLHEGMEATGNLQALPQQFRPLIEAYFERLAKDRVQE